MKSEQKMLFLYFFFNKNFRAAIELFMRIMLSNPTIIVMSQYPSNKIQRIFLVLSNYLYVHVPAMKK